MFIETSKEEREAAAKKLNDAIDSIRATGARFTMDGDPLDLGSFVEVNTSADVDPSGEIAAETLDALAKLGVGEVWLSGGGAAASFEFKRIA